MCLGSGRARSPPPLRHAPARTDGSCPGSVGGSTGCRRRDAAGPPPASGPTSRPGTRPRPASAGGSSFITRPSGLFMRSRGPSTRFPSKLSRGKSRSTTRPTVKSSRDPLWSSCNAAASASVRTCPRGASCTSPSTHRRRRSNIQHACVQRDAPGVGAAGATSPGKTVERHLAELAATNKQVHGPPAAWPWRWVHQPERVAPRPHVLTRAGSTPHVNAPH